MKTIARFTDYMEAQIAKSLLESHGITCHLQDKHIIAMDWFLSNALGGIRLKVAKPDAERAIQILNDVKENQPKSYSGYPCPRCFAENTERQKSYGNGWSLSMLALAMLPLPMQKENFICNECQHEWSFSRVSWVVRVFWPVVFVFALGYVGLILWWMVGF